MSAWAMISVAQLVDVVRDSSSRWAIEGDYHWVMRDAQPIGPIPMRGKLGLWAVDTRSGAIAQRR